MKRPVHHAHRQCSVHQLQPMHSHLFEDGVRLVIACNLRHLQAMRSKGDILFSFVDRSVCNQSPCEVARI
jgi:hypothetical protein